MSDNKAETRTYKDVQQEYQKSELLKKDNSWNGPNYDWNVDKIEELQSMKMPDLLNHLKEVIAGTLAINNLKLRYQQDTNSFLNDYTGKIDKLEKDFDDYYYGSRHSLEMQFYSNNNTNHLPSEENIDTSDTRPAKVTFFVSLALIIISNTVPFIFSNIVTGMLGIFNAVIVFPGSILFYLFAKWDLPFSQPIASWKNKRIRDFNRKLKKQDQINNEINHLTKDNLKEKFKYNQSLDANYSIYVEQMSNAHIVTKNQLNTYLDRISEHIKYFPLEETSDIRHLFRIYNALWTGRASNWKESLQVVDQSEQVKELQNTLVNEIRTAKDDVKNAIDETRQELISATNKQMGLLDDLNQTMERQRQSIEYWGDMQNEIQMDQLVLMEQARHR